MKNQNENVIEHSSEEEEDSEKSFVADTDNSPKFIPVCKLPEKLKTRKIIINVSDTQYGIIQEVAEELGWIVQKNQGYGDWDVWWTDRQLPHDTLYRMNLYQKINHFPGIYNLARKNMLGMNLMAMRQTFPKEYNFFPQTWIIPLQFSQFRNYYESVPKGKARTYIVKPQALSQGRGIFLTRNIEDIINGNKYVVQRYIKNPFLIEQLKFDLRIYVLMAGSDPLRLYIYHEGLTRFATKKYQEPNKDNLSENYIHLTNYSLNKNNPDYVYHNRQEDEEIGHKRSLSSTYKHLEKLGYDTQKLKQQINSLIVRTIIAGLPPISHQYQYCQPQQFENNMCFHILGFDVLITSDLKPYLIEVNHTPSFETSSPLDYEVKKNLIKDTLKLMRITPQNKFKTFEKNKEITKRRLQSGKRNILKGLEREKILKTQQKKRDHAEEGLMGGFEKIFPIKNEKAMERYHKMIKQSIKIHQQTQQTRKKMLRDEQDRIKAQKLKQKQKIMAKQQNSFIIRSSNITAENRNRKKFFDISQNMKEGLDNKYVEMSLNMKQQRPIADECVKDRETVPIKQVKFRISPQNNRYFKVRKEVNGEKSQGNVFSMRGAIVGNKKISNVSSAKKKRGQFLTPKTYEIVEKQSISKMFEYQKPVKQQQFLYKHLNKSLAHHQISLKMETSEGKREIRIIEKDKYANKQKRLSLAN